MGKKSEAVVSGALIVGIFFGLGIDPEGLITDALAIILGAIFPIFGFIAIIYFFYDGLKNQITDVMRILNGPKTTLIASIFAFSAGYLIVKGQTLGVYFLIIAYILGGLA